MNAARPTRRGLVRPLLSRAERVLRGETSVRDLWLVLACGMSYGLVMGCFGGRWLQLVYSAVKVPILLLATVGLSLPSFFVLNTLLGLRDDFRAVVRAIVGAQAGLTVILVSLAPVTAFWYVSSTDYRAAILFNGLMFGVASFGAQVILRRSYGPLIARDPKHRILLRVWLIFYIFVGVQLGWVLRPFVGDPANPVEFFRAEAWDNAYVIVARMFWEKVSG